ncbi:MAG: tetratricopeptide repeat protein, partial [Shewanella sp.]
PTDTSRLEKLQQLKCWHHPSNSADEITEALRYATQLMNDIPANASNSYRTDITLCQAWYLQLSGDVNGAFEGYNRGVKSAYEHEDLKLIADSTSLRGFLYSYIGDFSAALNDLVTAQGLYESLNLTGWANFNLNGIATSFRRYGDPQSAIRYYKKLKEIYLQTNKTEPAIFVTSDIGLALDELGEHEQAIEQFQIAYRYHKEQQEANAAAIAETNIAYSLIKLKRFTEAEQYLTQAQKVINETDPTAYSFMKLMLAELYFMRGEYNAAIEAATQSEQSFRSIQNHRGLVKLLPLKSDIYAAMSDYPAAHRTLKDFIQVNKTVDGNSLSQQTTQLKVKFDTSRIESENKRLIENQQLKEQELELLKKNKSLQYVIL